jgi:hypothetical protein
MQALIVILLFGSIAVFGLFVVGYGTYRIRRAERKQREATAEKIVVEGPIIATNAQFGCIDEHGTVTRFGDIEIRNGVTFVDGLATNDRTIQSNNMIGDDSVVIIRRR